MPYDTLPPAAAHRVELDGRERLIVSGVDDVGGKRIVRHSGTS